MTLMDSEVREATVYHSHSDGHEPAQLFFLLSGGGQLVRCDVPNTLPSFHSPVATFPTPQTTTKKIPLNVSLGKQSGTSPWLISMKARAMVSLMKVDPALEMGAPKSDAPNFTHSSQSEGPMCQGTSKTKYL